MMREIILYIAISLDGYLARPDGSVDFLTESAEPTDSDHGYAEMLKTVDTVLMGRTTYHQIRDELSPERWIYEGMHCYVASHHDTGRTGQVEYISGDMTEFVDKLRLQNGQNIWLVGGAGLISQFLDHDLIDRYIITVIPIILGDGIPLFSAVRRSIRLKLADTADAGGLVTLTYIRHRAESGVGSGHINDKIEVVTTDSEPSLGGARCPEEY